MGRVIVIITAIGLAFFLWRWFKVGYAKSGRPFAVKAVLVCAAVLLVALATAGRMHWVGAVLASLLAGLRFMLPMLVRSWPFLQRVLQRHQQGQQQSNRQAAAQAGKMTRAEALAVLGLDESATDGDIVSAHRRLIQKLHPDRGGNEYLATQLNLAKDTLLNS